MTPDAAELYYIYGLVRAAFDASGAPSGLDDAAVSLTRSAPVRALISRLPGSAYAAESIENNSGDVSWLSPRAMAHDRVLTWAQEHGAQSGGVIPLPMFSLWSSEAALEKSLSLQADDLGRVFRRIEGADEFGLRVHRRDSVLIISIADIDPDVARLREEAKAASPGQRYLLERKLADQAKRAVKTASQQMAKQIFEDLRARSRIATALPLAPNVANVPDLTMVLNGAFLVDRRRLDDFRAALAARVRDYQPRGLTFDFTGPWPPYNFVSEAGRAALRGE